MACLSGLLGQNDVTQRQANNTGLLPDQKVNKDKELTYLSINFTFTEHSKHPRANFAPFPS
jgi:hypothetical protein